MWCRAVTIPVAPACRASVRRTTSSGVAEGKLDLHGPFRMALDKVEGCLRLLGVEGLRDHGGRVQAAAFQPLHDLGQEVPVEPRAHERELLLHDLLLADVARAG